MNNQLVTDFGPTSRDSLYTCFGILPKCLLCSDKMSYTLADVLRVLTSIGANPLRDLIIVSTEAAKRAQMDFLEGLFHGDLKVGVIIESTITGGDNRAEAKWIVGRNDDRIP